MPLARDAERTLPHARGSSPGAPKGNRNALKHGRYTVQAIAERWEVVALIRVMRKMADDLA